MAACWSASPTPPRRRTPSSSIWSTWALRPLIYWMRGCCWSRWRHRLPPKRIDEAGIDRLRAVLRAEQHRRRFHAALAEQSKNPVLQLFIDILMRLTVRYAEDSRLDSASDALEAIDRRHREHSEIVAAVTAGDSARAKTLSERHAESVTAWLQDHHRPGPGGHAARPGPRGAAGQARRGVGDRHPRRYRHQWSSNWGGLRDRGRAAGTYRVSRSVLREAVRLLEYHAVARTRRGPGGGLVVAEPQAQASVDTIALYLQYRQPGGEDLRLVRDAIEIDNVAKVVKRRHAPDVRAFLDTHRWVIGEADDDPRKAGMEEFLFHTGLAQLAGNAVLELFLRILVELFRRHWASTAQPIPSHSDLADVQRAHLRIIEAIARATTVLPVTARAVTWTPPRRGGCRPALAP